MLLLLILLSASCMGQLTEVEQMNYGDTFAWRVNSKAAYLEFSNKFSHSQDRVVIWRRTETTAEGRRGQLVGRDVVMRKLTQLDEGLYYLKARDGQLLQIKRLEVSETYLNLDPIEGSNVDIMFSLETASSNVFLHTRQGDRVTIVDRGILDHTAFDGRIQMQNAESWFELTIVNLHLMDSGTFHLYDLDHNLVMTVHLDVIEAAPLWFYIGVAVGIAAAVLFCCCCVRRCCCKKSSTKADSSGTQSTAAPAVYHHDDPSGAAGRKYVYQPPAPTHPTPRPGQAAGSASSSGPSYSFHSPLVHYPTDANVTSPQRAVFGQGAAPAGPIGSDGPSADYGPRFEPKGGTFLSASPLSSDMSICDVYTSDKLNFR